MKNKQKSKYPDWYDELFSGHKFGPGGDTDITNTKAYQTYQEFQNMGNYYDNLAKQAQQQEEIANTNTPVTWQSDMTGEWERGDFQMIPFTNVGQYTYNWNPKGIKNRDLYSTESNPIKLDYANVTAKAPVMTSAQKEEMGRNVRNWVNQGLLSSANLTPEQKEAVELVNMQDRVARRPDYDFIAKPLMYATYGTALGALGSGLSGALTKSLWNGIKNGGKYALESTMPSKYIEGLSKLRPNFITPEMAGVYGKTADALVYAPIGFNGLRNAALQGKQNEGSAMKGIWDSMKSGEGVINATMAIPFGSVNLNTTKKITNKILPIIKNTLKDQFIAGMDTNSMLPLFKAKDLVDLENKLAKLNLSKDEIKTFKSLLHSGYDNSYNYIPQKVRGYYTFDPFELVYTNRSEVYPIAKKLGLKTTRNVGETPFTYEELVQNGELVPGIYDQVFTGAHGDFISANNMPDAFFNTYRKIPRGLRANQAELDAIARDNPAGRSGVFIHTHPGDLSIDSHPLGMHFGTKMGNNFIPIGNPKNAEMITLNEFGSKNLINATEKDIDLADQLFNGRVKILQPDGTYKIVTTPKVKPILVDSKDGIHKVLRFKSSDPSLPISGVDLQVRIPQEIKSIIDKGITRFNTKFNVNYPMSEIMPAKLNNDISKIWGTGILGTNEGFGITVPKIHGLTFALGGQTQEPPKSKHLSFNEWFKQVAPEYDDPNYDLESAYNNLPYNDMENWRVDPTNNHLPDTYKLPGHVTHSEESVYQQPPFVPGKWVGNKFLPGLINKRNYPDIYDEDRLYSEEEIYKKLRSK